MDASLSFIRTEAVGAMKTALVSAENLQLSLKTKLTQEEQALAHTHNGSPKEPFRAWYSVHNEV